MDAIKNKSLKIAILRTSSIGDVVLATSCLSLLKEVTPNAKIVWLGKSPSLSVIRDAFPSIECIEIDKNLKIHEILKRLSDVDFFLDLQVNLRSRIISHAFKNRFRRPIFSCSKSQLHRNRLVLESRIYGRRRELPLRAMESLKPQFVQMTDALLYALEVTKCLPKKFTARKEILTPYLPIEHYEDKNGLFSTIAGKRWIAISPGASYETKQAPLSLFSESLKKLQNSLQREGSQESLGLIFLGDKKDAEVCHFLIQTLNWSGPVLNFSGKLTLWENAVVLNKTLYLLSNDSSLGHIAEAVGTPVLVLFGPTVEGFGFAPHKKESRAYSSRLGCRPCSKHGKSPCRFGDKLCFLQISQDDIVQYMKELIMSRTLPFTKNLI